MQIIKQKLIENNRAVINFVIAVVCILLFLAFPASTLIQKITKTISFLILIPGLYLKLILKKNFSDFGFNLENPKIGIIGSSALIFLSAIIFIIIFRLSSGSNAHELPRFVVESFGWFLLYELLFVNLYLFSFEFFFRGFLLTLLSQKFLAWSVCIQAVVYALVIAAFRGTPAQIASEAVLAAGAGFVAQKTRSFLYGYFSAILFTLLLDAYLISIF